MIPQNISTNITASTYYVRHDDRSYAEKCMDRPENADIMRKWLKNEQLTDEETKRLTDCAEEQKATFKTIVAIVIALVVGSVIFSAIMAANG